MLQERKNFDEVITELADASGNLEASQKRLAELSREAHTDEEYERFAEFQFTAKRLAELSVFSLLDCQEAKVVLPVRERLRPGKHKNTYKVIKVVSLGKEGRQTLSDRLLYIAFENVESKFDGPDFVSHDIRYFLFSDTGELVVADTTVFYNYGREWMSPMEEVEFPEGYKHRIGLKDIRPLTLDDCIIDYTEEGVDLSVSLLDDIAHDFASAVSDATALKKQQVERQERLVKVAYKV